MLNLMTSNGDLFQIKRYAVPDTEEGGLAISFVKDGEARSTERILASELRTIMAGFDDGSSPIRNEIGETIELLRMSAHRLRLAYRGSSDGEYSPTHVTPDELLALIEGPVEE